MPGTSWIEQDIRLLYADIFCKCWWCLKGAHLINFNPKVETIAFLLAFNIYFLSAEIVHEHFKTTVVHVWMFLNI